MRRVRDETNKPGSLRCCHELSADENVSTDNRPHDAHADDVAIPSARAARPRIPAIHAYRYAEPFRGSEVGNKLAQVCGNCHSNQTNLPWYGRVVPISWWIESHVREGREELNFSEWTTYSARRRRDELESICGVISKGRMPPLSYSTMHPEARLEMQEKSAVCGWTTREIEYESNRIPPKKYLCPARSPMKTTERHEHASSAVTIPRKNEAQKRFGKKQRTENAPDSCGFSMTTLVR